MTDAFLTIDEAVYVKEQLWKTDAITLRAFVRIAVFTGKRTKTWGDIGLLERGGGVLPLYWGEKNIILYYNRQVWSCLRSDKNTETNGTSAISLMPCKKNDDTLQKIQLKWIELSILEEFICKSRSLFVFLGIFHLNVWKSRQEISQNV